MMFAKSKGLLGKKSY